MSMHNADPVARLDEVYSEPDPLERIDTRAEGISAIQTLAIASIANGTNTPTGEVWQSLFSLTLQVAEDVRRDIQQARLMSPGR